MKKREALENYLNTQLPEVEGINSTRFALALIKNKNILMPLVKELDIAAKFSKEFNEFLDKKSEIIITNSSGIEERPDGKKVYKFEEDKKKEVVKLLEELQKEYKEHIESALQQEKDYNELLETESSIKKSDLALIKETDLPNDLPPFLIERIMFMVE